MDEPELIERGQTRSHLLTSTKGARLSQRTACARTGAWGKGLLNVVGLQEIGIHTHDSQVSDSSSTYENNTRAFEATYSKLTSFGSSD